MTNVDNFSNLVISVILLSLKIQKNVIKDIIYLVHLYYDSEIVREIRLAEGNRCYIKLQSAISTPLFPLE